MIASSQVYVVRNIEAKMQDKIRLEDAYAIATPEDNMSLYARWAENYDIEFAKSHGYILPQVVAHAVHAIRTSGRVLDIGAGTGLLGQSLGALGSYDIDATDISAQMLEQARAKNIYAHVFTSDVTATIPVPDDTYHITTSSGTFTHGHVGANAIPEILRITKPGGVFVFSVNQEFWKKSGFDTSISRLEPRVAKITVDLAPIYGGVPENIHAADQAVIVTIEK